VAWGGGTRSRTLRSQRRALIPDRGSARRPAEALRGPVPRIDVDEVLESPVTQVRSGRAID